MHISTTSFGEKFWIDFVFTFCTDLTLKKEKLETLHKLIHRLPELNYIVFERLVFHLARYKVYI